MAMFDVYVEGATDPSPQALRRLAEVMSQRYGLPANDLVARLSKGRFRVKANVDQETAGTYTTDLEAIGARVTVVETRPGGASLPPPRTASTAGPRAADPPLARTAGSSLPPPRPGVSQPPPVLPPRPAQTSKPPPRTHRPSESPPSRPEHAIERPFSASQAPPHRPSNPSNQPYASGLSAAFHEDTPIPELGALDSANVSLSSVDGQDNDARAVAPMSGLPASIGPAPAPPPKSAKPERPKDVPLDLFAPPEAQAGEMKFELAADEVEHQARRKAATPPVAAPVVAAVADRPSSPVLRHKANSLSPATSMGGVVAADAQETPRWRFASGILLAVLVGVIPAHCVASVRESAFDTIDQQVVTVQAQANRADAPIPAAGIDAYRDQQLSSKKSKRNNIALVSLLIWAMVGGGFGYVWFRRVPWDKIKFGQNWP